MKRLVNILFVILTLFSCKTSQKVLTDSELLKILNIKVWRVPLPADNTKQWGIKIIDVENENIEYKPFDIKSKNEALISLKKNNNEFEFTLNQNNGTSRGELTIDTNYESITFFEEPRHFKDNLYAIGEIGTWDGYKTTPIKLIVIRLISR